jgi:putative hydrolase of HD superfamily
MDKLINFFHQIGKLKGKPRQGWVLRGLKGSESIAEHIFRTTLMSWILGSEKKLNTERLLKMAIIHDICEIYAGDSVPYDVKKLPKSKKARLEFFKSIPRLSRAEKEKMARVKYKKERKALDILTKDLSPKLGSEIINLWLDFEKGLSPEGRFFKQADRLETLMQALEYRKKYKNFPYHTFLLRTKESFDDPYVLEFVDHLVKEFQKK